MSKHVIDLFSITEVELIYRNKQRRQDRPKIKTSANAYELFLRAWDVNRIELLEEFKILLMDRNSTCMGIANIAVGGVSACLVDPKIVFSTALKAKASAMILAHNHPSGNLTPSQNDLDLTSRLKAGGKLLEIAVLDHLVITEVGYYSMADEGSMPYP